MSILTKIQIILIKGLLWLIDKNHRTKETSIDSNKKFTDIYETNFESDFGIARKIFRTIPYEVYELKTNNNILYCADNHILIDINHKEVFVKDLKPNDKIKSKNGIDIVISVRNLNFRTSMYCLEIDSKIKDYEHLYYANNLLSHNTTVAAAYINWFTTFNTNSNVLIVANNLKQAYEIMERVKYGYENMDDWIKPAEGLIYNRGEIHFANGCKIFTRASKPDAARGISAHLLYWDEAAFVSSNTQEAFWAGVSPTLAATNGKCIISSTPRTDTDLFYKLWAGANTNYDENGNPLDTKAGINGFFPIKILWNEHPNRDEKWARDQISQLGQAKFEQEMNCVSLNTFVSVKRNNDYFNLTINELIEILGKSITKSFYYNDTYEVLTPNGYSKFDGIKISKDRNCLEIATKSSSLICTNDHKLFSNNSWIYAATLQVNDKVYLNGRLEEIVSIKNAGIHDVADLINVEKNSEYYTNDFLSHNCRFVTDEETLIDSRILETLKHKQPEYYIDNNVRFWSELEDVPYMISLDPAEGTGGDYASIQVFRLDTLEQVAEWMDNNSSQLMQMTKLTKILNYLESFFIENSLEPKIFWTYENNSLGQGIYQIIENTGQENFPGTLVSDLRKAGTIVPKAYKKGMNTSTTSKRYANTRLKYLIESNKMIINSEVMIKQLKNYIARDNSYKAKSGAHDDLISATLLIVRMIDRMQQLLGDDQIQHLKEIVDIDTEETVPLVLIS